MVKAKTYTIGSLLLILLSSMLFIQLANNAAIEVKCTGTTFYINESGKMIATGTETLYLLNGSKKIARSACQLNYTIASNGTVEYRKVSTYKGNVTITDVYRFNSNSKNILEFPLSHEIFVKNGQGLKYWYQIRNVYYNGSTMHHLDSPFSLEKNMRVEWADPGKVINAYVVKKPLGKGEFNIIYSINSYDEKYSIRFLDPATTEYECYFNSTDCGFTGGTLVTSNKLYNATTTSSRLYSPWGRSCSTCNISFMIYTGNMSFGNVKFYYASTNGSIANEVFLLENYNTTHGVIKPEPGWDFSNGYIPFNTWTRIVIEMSDTSALSTIYAYDASGALYNSFDYGSRLQKPYTTSGKFFTIDTGGWTNQFWLTNFSIVDVLGTGSSGGGGSNSSIVDVTGSINFSLKSPLNGSNVSTSTVNISALIHNMNTTTVGGAPGTLPQTVYNDSFTSDPFSALWFQQGSWDWTANGGGVINSTADSGSAAWTQNLELGNYTNGYTISLNMSMSNFTNAKIFFGTNAGTQDGDRVLLERVGNGGTQINVKHDGGGYGSITVNTGAYVVVNITVNLTADTLTVRSGASSFSEALTNSHLTINGSYIAFVPGDNMSIDTARNRTGWNISNINISNLGTAYTLGSTSGNSTYNVSFYWTNNTLIYNSTGVANGTLASVNVSIATTGNYTWYATVRTEQSMLNITGLSFTKIVPQSTGNLSIALVTPSASGEVGQNQLFNFTVNISCSGGDVCGNVNAYLDPSSACSTSLCGNVTYTGGGDLNGKTWAQIHDILIGPYLTNPNGWIIYQTFNSAGKTLLWTPWYTYDNDMAEANLKDSYVGGTATFTLNTQVTDESSEWWIATVMNLTFSQVQQFTNSLDLCYDDTPSHNDGGISGFLTSWVCSRNGATITKNDKNSASDATARIAIGYYMCAKNPSLSQAERDFCLGRAKNITGQSIQQEWVNNCQPSPLNGSSNLCKWHLAGAAQAWGPGALTQSGEQMFIGYHESDIMHYLAAYAATGNSNYSQAARDETHQFLYVMGFDGGSSSADFVMPVANKHYYMSCPGGGSPCTVLSVGSAGGFEDADATRAWETCNNVRFAQLVYGTRGESLPWEFGQLNNYCTAWATRVTNGGSVSNGGTQLVDADSGCVQIAIGGTCKSAHGTARYREQAWVANMIGYENGTAHLTSFLAGPLSRFNVTKKYYDKSGGEGDYSAVGGNPTPTTIGYGIYGQVRMIRLIKTYSGYYDFIFTNETFNYTGWYQGSGSGTTGSINSTPPTNPTGNKSGTLVSTLIGDTPFYTINDNPNSTASCLQNMINGSSCTVTWQVNTTGVVGTKYEFWAFANTTGGSAQVNSTRINLTIRSINTTPGLTSYSVSAGNTTANITLTFNESVNVTFRYGSTTAMSNTIVNSTLSTSKVIQLTGLPFNSTVYWSVTYANFIGNSNTNGTFNFTTIDNQPPIITNVILTPTATGAAISWTTSESANSSINYGTTVALGTQTGNNVFVNGSRSIIIGSLTNNTLYFINISSWDRYGNLRRNGTFNFTTLNISSAINSTFNNTVIGVELGSTVTLQANGSAGTTICFDIGHHDYGQNYVCGSGSVNVNITINSFRNTQLNDSSSAKNLSFVGSSNSTVHVRANKLDDIINFTINLTGIINGTFPNGVKVYVNGTLSNDIGLLLNETKGQIVEFNDTTTSSKVDFLSPGVQLFEYVRLPKGADVTAAYMNFSGSSNFTLQEDADVVGSSQNSGLIYLNYSKPTSSSDQSKWQIRYSRSDLGLVTENVTLGSQCWDTSVNYVLLRIVHGGSSIDYQCLNASTEWVSLITVGAGGQCSESSFCQSPSKYVSVGVNYDGSYSSSGSYNGHHQVWCNEGCSLAAFSYEEGMYWHISPLDSWMEAGLVTGVRDWNYTGSFTTTDTSTNFSSKLNTFLANCVADTQGYCDAPLYVYSFGGAINASTVRINFTYDTNPVQINLNLTQRFLDNATGNVDYNNETQDRSGNNFHLTNSAVPAVFNSTTQRFDFNATTQQLTSPAGTITGNDTITVSAWVMTKTDRDAGFVYGFSTGSYDSGFGLGYRASSDKFTFEMRNDGDSSSFILSNTTATLGLPYHIAVTANRTYYFAYVNGVLQNSTTRNYTSFPYNRSIAIGRVNGGAATWAVNGSVGDVRVWNVMLNSTEIANVAANRSVRTEDMTAFWPMNSTPTYGRSVDIPITISSSQTGIIQIDDIRFEYAGGNRSYNVTAHNDLYTVNATARLDVYYSRWNFSYPVRVNFLEFIPSSPTSRRVQPFGQTPAKPIFNITGLNYGGKKFNWSVSVNETYSCVNLSFANVGDYNQRQDASSNWTTLLDNITLGESAGVWIWADYNCNFTNWRLWEPNISMRACAVNTTCSASVS
jgi:hypothetical protein